MLFLGIILTILGVIIFQWCAKAMSEPLYNRPLIFYRTIPVLIINLLWIGLLVGGLCSFWKVNYKIVIFIITGFVILCIIGSFLGSYKNKSKIFFQIYKQLKIYRPQATEEDILHETVRLYFQKFQWDMERINRISKYIFDEKYYKVRDVKDVLHSVFNFENPDNDFGARFNFKKSMKELAKKNAAIEWAYKNVFGEKTKITKRAVLSKDSLKRMSKIGLDPDEMTNEQLAALEGLENIEKSHWLSRLLSYGSIVFGFGAIINLLALEFGAFVFAGIISLLLMYIAYQIQSKVASKKFYEASILKWSQEQRQKNKTES